MFIISVGATVVLAGAALVLFYDANRMRVANATPAPLDTTTLEEYEQKQGSLLEEGGLADDRVLGGEAGQSKRAKKLGAKRKPIDQAMAAVRQDLKNGGWTPTQLTESQQEILDRLDMGGVTPEMILAAKSEPAQVQAGKQVYEANCAACHKVNGSGLVGPNLTDEYWIHGRSPSAIYKVIAQGVAAKGMPAWGHLGEEKMKQAAAYVLTLKGKDLEGKPPQGVDAEGNPPPTTGG